MAREASPCGYQAAGDWMDFWAGELVDMGLGQCPIAESGKYGKFAGAALRGEGAVDEADVLAVTVVPGGPIKFSLFDSSD